MSRLPRKGGTNCSFPAIWLKTLNQRHPSRVRWCWEAKRGARTRFRTRVIVRILRPLLDRVVDIRCYGNKGRGERSEIVRKAHHGEQVWNGVHWQNEVRERPVDDRLCPGRSVRRPGGVVEPERFLDHLVAGHTRVASGLAPECVLVEGVLHVSHPPSPRCRPCRSIRARWP